MEGILQLCYQSQDTLKILVFLDVFPLLGENAVKGREFFHSAHALTHLTLCRMKMDYIIHSLHNPNAFPSIQAISLEEVSGDLLEYKQLQRTIMTRKQLTNLMGIDVHILNHNR